MSSEPGAPFVSIPEVGGPRTSSADPSFMEHSAEICPFIDQVALSPKFAANPSPITPAPQQRPSQVYQSLNVSLPPDLPAPVAPNRSAAFSSGNDSDRRLSLSQQSLFSLSTTKLDGDCTEIIKCIQDDPASSLCQNLPAVGCILQHYSDPPDNLALYHIKRAIRTVSGNHGRSCLLKRLDHLSFSGFVFDRESKGLNLATETTSNAISSVKTLPRVSAAAHVH